MCCQTKPLKNNFMYSILISYRHLMLPRGSWASLHSWILKIWQPCWFLTNYPSWRMCHSTTTSSRTRNQVTRFLGSNFFQFPVHVVCCWQVKWVDATMRSDGWRIADVSPVRPNFSIDPKLRSMPLPSWTDLLRSLVFMSEGMCGLMESAGLINGKFWGWAPLPP